MKTRILSALLAVLMLASLASCSAKPERGNITNVETSGDSSSNNANEADHGNITNEEASGDSSSNDTAEAEYSVPTQEGNTYSSSTLGAKITVDEGWVFSTDEEIAELNNVVLDMAGSNYADQLKNADIIYDMMAANENTGDNISINFQNMGLLFGKVITPETYINYSISSVKDMLSQVGAENVESSIEKVEFAGKEETALFIKSEIYGVSMYQLCIAKSCGNYMANVTITTMLEDSTADILAKFAPID